MAKTTTSSISKPTTLATPKQKIVTHLWFADKAEEAAKFYASVFKNSKVNSISRYGAAAAKVSGRPKGSVMTVAFELDGQNFLAINGGPIFQFSEAISLVVKCTSQKEIDDLWTKLTANGGEPGVCGWLKDKYGLSWQVVPANIDEAMADPNEKRRDRVMEAVLKMTKLDVQTLQAAYEKG